MTTSRRKADVSQDPLRSYTDTHTDAPTPEHTLFADDLKQGTQLLDGQYTIIDFLNSGGFGITYLARDSLDRTVVIKECFPGALCQRNGSAVRARSRKHAAELRSFVQTFVDEARSLAKLSHPNIVGVHQVFEDNDTAYMAIDFIDGKDLQDILESTDQAFTPDEVVVLLRKMLSAVEFIHQAGILHRDISPDNILLDANRNPVLIDFGAASQDLVEDTRVLTARRVVKDGYSPQEFYLTGAEQTAASDLYALGATLHHIITGRAPPHSQRRLASVAEGASDPYVPLDGNYPGYPPGFLATIDQAVRVLQKDRPQSAADWIALLPGEEAEPEPVLEPMAKVAEPATVASDFLARNFGFVIGAGTVFVLAAVVGLWQLFT
ncbi:SPS1 Serine/threonine protein kinase [Paracoccaceae bacterium]|jgi:serine/threonine protein kinase